MQASTVQRVGRVAAIVAVALCAGGIVSLMMSAGPGKGGNLGAALLALFLWLVSLAAAIVWLVAFIIARRLRAGAHGRGFDVSSRPPAG